MLTIFSKPNCPNCDQAKRYLTSLDIDFNSIDITQDIDARNFVVGEGHRSVPQFYDDSRQLCNYNEIITKSKEQINEMIA